MGGSNRPRRAVAVLLALVAAACAGSSGPDLTEPAEDVSGSWSGEFTEQNRPPQDAVSGEIALSFVQAADGSVSGQAALTEMPCLPTLEFAGAVLDSVLLGTATMGDVELRFEVDARNADQGAYGTLEGTFNVISGAGCPTPFEGWFLATGDPPL